MSVDEQEIERRLRTTLTTWAEAAPTVASTWVGPKGRLHRADARWRIARLGPVAIAAALVAAVVAVQFRPAGEPLEVLGRRDIVVAEIPVGDALGVRVLAVGDAALFVASENDRGLYRVDRASHEVTGGPSLAVPDAVGVAGGAVFAIVDGPTRLARLDPVSLSIISSVALTGEPVGMQVVADHVWVRDADGSGRRFDTEELRDAGPLGGALAVGFQHQGAAGLWRSDPGAGTVLRLDPSSGAVLATVPVAGEPRTVAVGDEEVWVADVAHDRVLRLDPGSGEVASAIDVGRFPHGLALGDGRLWVTNFEDGTLSTIDTDRGVVLTTVPIGVRPGSVVLDHGELWVSLHQEGLVRLVDPAELEAHSIRPIDEREVNVDIGGRTLFLRCMGAGDPDAATVVLESGAGQWSEHELFIQYGLQSTHRVCAYDRAGLGRSDSGPEPRTAERIADDLQRALGGAHIPGPYVLVGHGHGGLYARLFAVRHPADVEALVLVDSFTTDFTDELRPLLDDDQLAELDEQIADPEFASLDESSAQVAAAGQLGRGLPLVVVTGDQTLGGAEDPLGALWQRHQRSLLELSTASRLIVVEGASAVLATNVPEAVVDAVRSVAQA